MIDLTIDPKLASDIDASEKNELEAYLDSLDNWTIGRGHLLPKPAPGRSWKGFTISQAVSDRYFIEDLTAALIYAKALPEFKQCDTDCRRNALTELCFNMRGKWVGFHDTRAAMEAQNWPAVRDGLLDSEWAAEVQPHHYVNGACSRCSKLQLMQGPHSYCELLVGGRATRLANYFLTGEYL